MLAVPLGCLDLADVGLSLLGGSLRFRIQAEADTLLYF